MIGSSRRQRSNPQVPAGGAVDPPAQGELRIALFASSYAPHIGGVEEVVRQLGRQLRQMKHRPIVVTNRWPKILAAEERVDGLEVYRYVFRVFGGRLRQNAGALLHGLPTQRQIRQALRGQDIQLIHLHCVSSNVPYAIAAKRRLVLPLIVTLHGELSGDATGLYQRSRLARMRLRLAMDEADAITAPSLQVLKEAEAFWGKPFGHRGHVVPNGIRLSDFQKAGGMERGGERNRPYILSVGRLVPQKGFDTLLKAFAQLSEADAAPANQLMIVGDGPEKVRLDQLARELGIRERVHLTGALEHTAVRRLLRGCTAFVLASRYEAFGMATLEAMASCAAVVATEVGGVSEVVEHEHTGLLVPPNDPTALAAALRRIMVEPRLRARLATAAGERAQAFDWHSIGDQYLQIYRQLLEERLVVRAKASPGEAM